MVVERPFPPHHAASADGVGQVTTLAQLMTCSESMMPVLTLVRDASVSDAGVLVVGEYGTGKELVASAIHDLSARRERALVRVNCTAIPAELLESEIFGHSRGAFPGADSDRQGVLEIASGGSILLDDIAEMSAALQSKLLRALRDRGAHPIGGTRPIVVDVRLICASEGDPRTAVAEGRLSEELFLRISTVMVRLPALRERRGDIPLLAQHCLKHFAEGHGRTYGGFHEAAMRALVRYDWPGNLRELEHIVERAVIASKGQQIALSDLPERVRKPAGRPSAPMPAIPAGRTLEELERLAILQTLELTKGNKRAAAHILGIHRPTLYNKLRKYHLPASRRT